MKWIRLVWFSVQFFLWVIYRSLATVYFLLLAILLGLIMGPILFLLYWQEEAQYEFSKNLDIFVDKYWELT